MSKQCIRLFVRGKVQGVFFRQALKVMAIKNNVTGWVRNLDDGRVEALLAGDIDAAQTYPPFATEALANPNIIRLFDTSQTPGDIIDLIFTHDSILTSREGDLAKVARAFERAIQYQNTHHEDAIARMAKREGLTPAEFIDALSGLEIISQKDQSAYLKEGKLLELLKSTHTALASIGVIQKSACGPECFTDVALK